MWQLFQFSCFHLLQEAANMLHLTQNRLKEEEQHLLKGGSKWDFFTSCIREIAKYWLLHV